MWIGSAINARIRHAVGTDWHNSSFNTLPMAWFLAEHAMFWQKTRPFIIEQKMRKKMVQG
jgi:hypothetical protein